MFYYIALDLINLKLVKTQFRLLLILLTNYLLEMNFVVRKIDTKMKVTIIFIAIKLTIAYQQ